MVESIPKNLTYSEPTTFMSTTDAWLKLISLANSSIEIASYYWTFKCVDTGGFCDESSKEVGY